MRHFLLISSFFGRPIGRRVCQTPCCSATFSVHLSSPYGLPQLTQVRNTSNSLSLSGALTRSIAGIEASWASPLPSKLATTTGRNVFVILRTGISFSVALHLLLRERSYFQLIDSNQAYEGTFTLPFRRPQRRTRCVSPRR